MKKRLSVLLLKNKNIKLQQFLKKNYQVADILEPSSLDSSEFPNSVLIVDSKVYLKDVTIPTQGFVICLAKEENEAEVKDCIEKGATDVLFLSNGEAQVFEDIKNLLTLLENNIDLLSGVMKGEVFYGEATSLLATSSKEYDLIVTNVEGFKLINASFSEDVGDTVLGYLSTQFKQAFCDFVLGSRLYNDRFAFLVEHDNKYTAPWFESLALKLEKDAPVKNLVVKFGIYPCLDKTLSIYVLCNRSFLALDTIKKKYNTFSVKYTKELFITLLKRQQLLDDSFQGFEEKEFEIYYQPKIQISSSAIVGAEALIRWNHPKFGLLMPKDFIPLFEESGFITKLDFYVIKNVCSHIHRWLEAKLPIVPISVNISQIDFFIPSLDRKIYDAVNEAKVDPKWIHLEVTESAYMANHSTIVSVINSLRRMGFKIEMDDFGTGYSSLNMLCELPVDIIKLDMQLIQNNDNDIKKSVLSFIIALSKWLNLDTIAEGVETAEELENLKQKGCNLVQGYFYSWPMRVLDFETYLVEHQKKDDELEKLSFMSFKGQDDVKTILFLEEDQQTNLKQLIKDRTNYQILEAPSASNLCDTIIKEYSRIDVVLLSMTDFNLDVMRILTFLNSSPSWKHIPVILIADDSIQSEIKAVEMGAAYYLRPDYDFELLNLYLRKSFDSLEMNRIRNELELKTKKLQDVAYRDSLTEFYNRRGCDYAVSNLSYGQSHALFLLDVDNLKLCNDDYGHDNGDLVLKRVASTIKQETRDGDILVRLGGDEFVLVLLNLSNPQQALKKGISICNAIKTIELDIKGCHPTCSMGATIFKNKNDFRAACKRADIALYEAKKTNKGSCKLFIEE